MFLKELFFGVPSVSSLSLKMNLCLFSSALCCISCKAPLFTNFHFIFFFSFLLALPLKLHSISPERLCFVSQLQAERFITAICSFYPSRLSLSISQSLSHTGLCYYLPPLLSFFLTVFFKITFMFRSCSISSVCLMVLDSPLIHFSPSSLFISLYVLAQRPK